MRRVLLLGTDEFIGSRVLLALADSRWATPVVNGPSARHTMHPNIERIPLQLADPASMSHALRGVDAVVNCLSGKPASIVLGAKTLFGAAARVVPEPLIVHLSSMAVYGSVEGDVSEDAPLRGDLGDYARAKIQAESIAAAYPRKVILRPGVEFGPAGELWSGRVARWLYARRLGDLGAAGDGYCNLVYIDDLVTAILAVLQRPEAIGATFNLAMQHPPTWNEYFVRYAKALGAVPVKRISRRRLALETNVLAVPLRVLELAMRTAGLRGFPPPPVPPSLLIAMRQEIRLNCTQAQRALAWTCKPLDRGLAETAGWFGRSVGNTQRSFSTEPKSPTDSE